MHYQSYKNAPSINVSISVNTSNSMIENGGIGYSITLEPTKDKEDKKVVRLNCNPNTCEVHHSGFKFDKEEEYDITVLPVTRAMLKRDPELHTDNFKHIRSYLEVKNNVLFVRQGKRIRS